MASTAALSTKTARPGVDSPLQSPIAASRKPGAGRKAKAQVIPSAESKQVARELLEVHL